MGKYLSQVMKNKAIDPAKKFLSLLERKKKKSEAPKANWKQG